MPPIDRLSKLQKFSRLFGVNDSVNILFAVIDHLKGVFRLQL